MKLKLFFETSKGAAERLTALFDFVWPTAAAIWNLRWQVGGLVGAYPAITEEELLGRFVSGSGIRGANLRRSCIETSWEDQKQEFARFLLFEFCAMYEAWCEGCLLELGQPEELSKALQFPTAIRGGKPVGVGHAVGVITKARSPTLSAALLSPLSTNRKNSKAQLEELLVCYRYFKEARNALVHAGGTPSKAFRDAEAAYSQRTASSLGVKEAPAYIASVPGQPPSLSLRGVVGFGEIVLRLICTLDLELMQSASAEAVFIKRWRARHGYASTMISSDPVARLHRIRRLFKKLDLPSPVLSPALDAWLTSNGCVS